MSSNISANYVLSNNIDCSDSINWNDGAGFIPVGDTNNPFIGTLNGNGHTISDLYIDDTTARADGTPDGLFAYMANAQISNLTLVSPVVTSDLDASGLAGVALDSSIANVQITGGTIILSSGQTGELAAGMIAQDFGSAIIQSSFSGSVTGDGIGAGGLTGIAQNDDQNTTIFTNDFTQADIVQTNDSNDYTGGMFALVSGARVSDSYASGTITVSGRGTGYVGGLSGAGAGDGTVGEGIFSSFAHVAIDTSGMTNSPNVGGLNGSDVGNPTLLNSSDYFDATLAGTQKCTGDTNDSCSVVNISSTQTTYFDNNHTNPPLNAWDFTSIWGTTSLLPDFVPNAAVVPLVVRPDPRYVKVPPAPPVQPSTPSSQPVAKATPVVATLAQPHSATAAPTTGTVPSSGLSAIAGAIGHFIARLPVGVVVAFPYLLFILLILLGLAAMIELGRELRRLRQIQLLIDAQTNLAEESDNF